MLEQIGEGGMGTVWLAEHTMLGRRAAIKLLHPTFSARPEIVTRFFNEARAATAIADPGIVQIFDYGHHSDGSAYIAMEMLDGEPLDRRLRRLGRLPLVDALRIVRQAASTLGVAHALGIVHRDLKPENIFLVPDPEVIGGERTKLLDFGIAKLTSDSTPKTRTSAVMGTPTYMSPEQCRGAGHVDQRTDVYALGCILFTLLTGGPPFDAEGSGELIAMHLREAPPLPSSRVPDLPPEIDDLVQCCLEKDPNHRFPSGTELAAEIGRLLGAPSMPTMSASPLDGAAADGSRARAVTAITLLLAGTEGMIRAATKSSHRVWIAGAALLIGAGLVTTSVGMSGGAGLESSPTDAAGTAEPAAWLDTAAVSDPAPAPAPAPASTAAAVAAEAPANAAAAEAADDPSSALTDQVTDQLTDQMTLVLVSFIEWSHAHPGEPCPPLSILGASIEDPWGTPFAVTCTDQPANQIAGVISAGPDRALGTPDDRGSWQMAEQVTALIHGPRWTAAVSKSPVMPARPARPAKPAKPAKPVKKKILSPNIADDIPSER